MRTRDATKEREGGRVVALCDCELSPVGRGKGRKRDREREERDGKGQEGHGRVLLCSIMNGNQQPKEGKLRGVSIYCHPWKTRRPCLVNNNRGIMCTGARAQIAGVYNAGRVFRHRPIRICALQGLADYRYSIDTVYLSVPVHAVDVIAEVSATWIDFSPPSENRPKNIN